MIFNSIFFLDLHYRLPTLAPASGSPLRSPSSLFEHYLKNPDADFDPILPESTDFSPLAPSETHYLDFIALRAKDHAQHTFCTVGQDNISGKDILYLLGLPVPSSCRARCSCCSPRGWLSAPLPRAFDYQFDIGQVSNQCNQCQFSTWLKPNT